MKHGSLFSGYEGLGMAVEAVSGATTAWVSDVDPGACKILAHRYPDTPNLGDITKVDWSQVEPVDIISGGFPCQDVSHAGKRAGLGAGTRTGLWSHMALAIETLRPAYVVAENVRGLHSARADSDVEPCPWCMGDGEDEPPMRALGAVLADLADIGYDARWVGVRAADVGAPHGRFRVFIVAADTGCLRGDTGRIAAPGQAQGSRALAVSGVRGGASPPDAGGQRHGRGQDTRDVGPVDREDADRARERQRPREVPRDRGDATAPDAQVDEQRKQAITRPLWHEPGYGAGRVDWGAYEPAIRRWETILGRPAPAPTQPGRTGNPQLSPAFVEWMMGLPAGWVTEVPGLTRNQMLKALGNGVVPQQAAAALTWLMDCEAAA